MTDALHVKYRPDKFEQVLGQNAAVESLIMQIEQGSSHAFLFCGPSGVGKTTLARICAGHLGCEDVLEIDAATYTGVDDMRAVTEKLQYKSFLGGARAIIVDECHMLSRNAWNSLLKIIEEGPADAFWFLCTTEAGKILPTIKTRCTSYTLNSVDNVLLEKLVKRVCKAEQINVSTGVLELIVREARGSPRQALVNLDQCRGMQDRKKAAELLHTALESDATIELCRFLMKRGSWAKAMSIVENIKQPAEGIRIIVCNYVSVALINAKSDKEATALLNILAAFSQTYNQSEGNAPLLISIGRVIYAG